MFTDQFLRTLKPQEQKYDIREKTRRGFSVTVHPSGEISFIFFYHYMGRKRRMTLGKYPWLSIGDARKLHQEALIVLESGHDPAIDKRYRIVDSSAHRRLRNDNM